ncbi:5149_t:CDS:2 [Diversispora eburnea]|uniref:D-arabinono-1,4-lactone oxidase n=1 Tax=Diversispora eburnea TaxID=1213867 RepID=A0A9N9CH77_9GLOM|nr:5149_t:CDS:2 [Diversispora eburnea]
MGLFDKAKEIYDGNDIYELNDKCIKDKTLNEKLEKLVSKAHQKLLSDYKGHEGPQLEIATNILGTIKFKADIEDITSFNQLIEIMKNSEKEKKQVKAVGTFSAFSAITQTSGYLLNTSQYSGVTKTDVNLLTQNVQSQAQKDNIVYYDAKCGTTLKLLIDTLKEDGRALINLSGWGNQCIASLNATSTHGSGITLQPLCGSVVSVDMVVPGGQLYRVEPTNGITDAVKFKSSNPSIILIQDDDSFNASIVNIGALGVTYSQTIATLPLYSIIEEREEVTWEHAKSILRQLPYESNPYLSSRNCELWISPYTDYVSVTKRNLATSEDEKNYPKPEIKDFYQDFIKLPLVIEISKKLNIGFGANDNYIQATDAILAKLKELREQHNLNINGPAAMRFSAASSQYLSMAYNENLNEPRAYLEMPILVYELGIDYYKHVYNPLVDVVKKFNGRCHWGQYLSPELDNEYLINAYSNKSVNSFITQLTKFDPNGLMSNELTKKFGLTPDGKIYKDSSFDFSNSNNNDDEKDLSELSAGEQIGGGGIKIFERIINNVKKETKSIWNKVKNIK